MEAKQQQVWSFNGNMCERKREAETKLEDSIIRLTDAHAEIPPLATADLMDLVRDIVDAVDSCRYAGTSHGSVRNIIEATFGAVHDKEIDRVAIEQKNATRAASI